MHNQGLYVTSRVQQGERSDYTFMALNYDETGAAFCFLN